MIKSHPTCRSYRSCSNKLLAILPAHSLLKKIVFILNKVNYYSLGGWENGESKTLQLSSGSLMGRGRGPVGANPECFRPVTLFCRRVCLFSWRSCLHYDNYSSCPPWSSSEFSVGIIVNHRYLRSYIIDIDIDMKKWTLECDDAPKHF